MSTNDGNSHQSFPAHDDGTPAMGAPTEEELEACGSILFLNETKSSKKTEGANDKLDLSVGTSKETSPSSDRISEPERNTSSHSAAIEIGKEPLKRKQSSQEGNERRKRKLPIQPSAQNMESLGENDQPSIMQTENSGNTDATDWNNYISHRNDDPSNHHYNDHHDNTNSDSGTTQDGNGAKKIFQEWEEKFKLLVEYKIKHGTTSVQLHQNRTLCHWVFHQRKLMHRLSRYQCKLLDSIGFDWKIDARELRKDEWMKMYNQLLEYKEEYGNTHVPTQPKIFASLGFWADRQRKIGLGLERWRIQLLDKIGFEWDSKGNDNWMKRYRELVEFKKRTGTTFVSRTVNAKLAGWCRFQRNQCKEQWRIDLLNDIGFIWSPKSEQQKDHWMKMYHDMVEYKKKYGTTCVPLNWKENRRLGIWVRNQRVGCTEQWRIDLLDKVDFVWSVYAHKKQKKSPLPTSDEVSTASEVSNIHMEKK